MAVTKVYAIRDRLDKRVQYVTNEEKTTLDAKIVYAVNPEKTEQVFFTDTLNCSSVESAFAEMQATKKRFGKTDGVLGYHFIQSFKPGEVTPEQAHEIGMEFARCLFGSSYEAVVGTHLDKAHLHNHVVVNSVSFLNGEKFHSSPEKYYNLIRGTSDDLCRENDLSVITPKGRGKQYAEWKAEKNGQPTIRSLIRADIDRVIGKAYTFSSFLELLRAEGYEIHNSLTRKYTTVRPPGAKRAIRLESLGDGYTEQAIKDRIAAQRQEGYPKLPVRKLRRYRLKGKRKPGVKITGFQALYLRYVYLLRKGRVHSRKLPFSIRQEVIRLEQYERQYQYLQKQCITTQTELEQRISRLEQDIQTVTEQRKPLYSERKNADETEKSAISEQIEKANADLRLMRRELRLCRQIEADIPKVSEQVRYAAGGSEKNIKKERASYEYER